MFTPKTISPIKATVPVLQQHGEAITQHFYQLMLRDYPQVKAFFNEAHQASGTQARALAGAVLAFGSHIDRLEELADDCRASSTNTPHSACCPSTTRSSATVCCARSAKCWAKPRPTRSSPPGARHTKRWPAF